MRTKAFLPFDKFLTAFLIVAVVFAVLPLRPAYAASITVETATDELDTPVGNGLCSLREAIINANNNAAPYPDCTAGSGLVVDVITLESGTTYTLSLTTSGITGGDLDISDAAGLTIQASGDSDAIIDANGIDRVLDTTAASGDLTLINITLTNGTTAVGGTGGGIGFGSTAGTLTLNNSTISNNAASGTTGCGAGIYNNTSATINIINSTIANNSCNDPEGDGGGLYIGNGGTVSITNSTFYNNSSNDDGGGMRLNGGTATIVNSTFVSNTADNRGGAIAVSGGSATIDFSTFSENAAGGGINVGGAVHASDGSAAITASILANSTAGKDCGQSLTGTVTLTNSILETNGACTGTDIISGDPDLGALADNGGPTQTMAITTSSPAFDVADSCDLTTTTDQRDLPRPQGDSCDLGAYELQDVTAPTVSTIVRADTDPTNASSVDYTVTFSEIVFDVGTSDFTLTTSGVSGATVSGISGSDAVYTLTVTTGTGNGTIRLDLTDDDSITDSVGHKLGGTGTGNGDFTAGQSYTVDKTAPNVSSILRADANPSSASSVDYTVTFSESVNSVDPTDFTLALSGVSGATVSEVSGSGTTYTVTVNTGTGGGTLRLDLVDDDSIVDNAGNPLAGAGAGNGDFTGQTYTMNDNAAPTNISLSASTVTENLPANTTVGSFTTTDPDSGDTFTYSFCGGTDDTSFSISGNTLKTAAVFDFETQSSYSICVRSTDNGSLSFDKTFTITVTDAGENAAPTNISLSASTVTENLPAGTTVGSFTTTDPNVGDTFTYSLVSGTGSTDNAAFTISTNQLKTAYPFNYLSKNSYSLRVRTTDNGGLSFEKAFTITVVNTAPIFGDVPDTYWAVAWIERLYNSGITGGCSASPLQYCPDNTVTRAQMAIFLLKGIHGSSYTPPAVGASTGFADVPTSYWAAAWIKQLAAEGITGGCGGGNYCPDSEVTRAQMAIFLLKAEHGASYTPPAVGASTGFADVSTSYWAAAWIKQLAAEGITGGCGGGNYCPDNSVTRAQMAVFLVKTFSLP